VNRIFGAESPVMGPDMASFVPPVPKYALPL
jgi:hypothetical protein